jgi:hypothetical protein
MTTKYDDLNTFYAQRVRRHREYVSECIKLVEKVATGFEAYLGPGAKVLPEAMKASEGQRSIAAHGVFEEKGVAVFAYAVELKAQNLSPRELVLFLTVGKKGETWFVSIEGNPFPLPNGGEDDELQPAYAQFVRAIQEEVRRSFPTGGAP